MVQPVPGHGVTTPYGRRGSHWSCSPDSSGNGIHTGADMAAPVGAKVVAARPGTARHVNFGSAFGSHQLEVRCSDGTSDFYAHMRSRVADGTKVDAGQKVGEVGQEGNVTGPHLHFERHKAQGTWSCSVVTDPAPSIKYAEKDDDMPLNDDDLSAIAKRVNQVLGDFNAQGEKRDPKNKNPEQADARIRQLENVLRDVQERVKRIENKM